MAENCSIPLYSDIRTANAKPAAFGGQTLAAMVSIVSVPICATIPTNIFSGMARAFE